MPTTAKDSSSQGQGKDKDKDKDNQPRSDQKAGTRGQVKDRRPPAGGSGRPTGVMTKNR